MERVLVSRLSCTAGTVFDELTGFLDRASMLTALGHIDLAGCAPLSVIVGDINGMRLINAVGGYSLGDSLIQSAARVVEGVCRDRGIIGRWGEDEFLIVLPGVGYEDVALLRVRIRSRLRATADLSSSSLALGVATRDSPQVPIASVVADAETAACRRKLLEPASPRSSLVSVLRKILSQKTHETEAHPQRLIALAVRIGAWLRLSDSTMSDLMLLCELHDIGKLGIPDGILDKTGPLEPYEWSVVRTHPELGREIAESAHELVHLGSSVLSHHEFWDGSGYPHGLKGVRIPLIARITAIVDAYDVMTHDRPYRKAMPREMALREILRCSGSQFDPGLASVFVQIIGKTISGRTASTDYWRLPQPTSTTSRRGRQS